MKKFLFTILTATCALTLAPSCEAFLDKSPDMGLSEADVYKDYTTMRGFMDRAYTFLDQWHGYHSCNNGRAHIGSISDEFASLYNSAEGRFVHSGNWLSKDITAFEIGNSDANGGTSIYKAYQGLRIVNRVIRDIDKVQSISQKEKDELLGQSYFLRAWFYFQLMIRYGGMPIFDQLFIGEGEEDLPRETYHGSHDWMMTDMEKALALLPDSWDQNNTGRPTKVAALAFRGMAQLYDASPLMQNDLSTVSIFPYDKERAAKAARYAHETLQYIQSKPELGYKLMDKTEYKHIFYWPIPPYSQPEFLWYNREQTTPGPAAANASTFLRYLRSFWLPGVYAEGTGNDACAYNAPTQNMVDLFEKMGDEGDYWPIQDPRAHYDPQQPYKDRDPRLANNILVPGEKWGENLSGEKQYITTYVGGALYKESQEAQSTKNRQLSGYMCKKFLWEGADMWLRNYAKYRVITVFIRVAQVYLDYAEASFEATGSATAKVEGCSLSALEALNVIRNRAGIGDLPEAFVADPNAFREALRRERGVELMFENNRWWDLRRWMIAHEVFQAQYPIKGMKATPKNANHNSVKDKSTLEFTYEVVDMVPEQRVFEMRNYWYPFSMNEVASMNNLQQNPLW